MWVFTSFSINRSILAGNSAVFTMKMTYKLARYAARMTKEQVAKYLEL